MALTDPSNEAASRIIIRCNSQTKTLHPVNYHAWIQGEVISIPGSCFATGHVFVFVPGKHRTEFLSFPIRLYGRLLNQSFKPLSLIRTREAVPAIARIDQTLAIYWSADDIPDILIDALPDAITLRAVAAEPNSGSVATLNTTIGGLEQCNATA